MRVGRVVGTVVSTQKNERLTGAKLLLVHLVEPVLVERDRIGPADQAILAVDTAQAGVGDMVLVVTEGRAAASTLGRRGAPVDAAIVGIVDTVSDATGSSSGTIEEAQSGDSV